MTSSRFPLTGFLQRIAGGLRSSHLAALLTTLFLIDLVIVDPLPFVDEAVLALLALLAGRWASRRETEPVQQEDLEGPLDVTARGSDDGPSVRSTE